MLAQKVVPLEISFWTDSNKKADQPFAKHQRKSTRTLYKSEGKDSVEKKAYICIK